MNADSIVQEITIRASAEVVFDALAQPEQRLAWWGRTGRFRTTRMESDLRQGGKWTMWFETPHGPTTLSGEYRVIDRPRVLEFTWCPGWYGSSETVVRVELEPTNDGTRVRLTHSKLVTEADRANNTGWPDLLAALRNHLESASR
jgi:uncharacterized protein YndB with AHSA1/START domain